VELPKNSTVCAKSLILSKENPLPKAEGFAKFGQSRKRDSAGPKTGFFGNNLPFFSTDRSLTDLFTLGLGITGADRACSLILLTIAVGAGPWASWASDWENLTKPKAVSTIRCTAIEVIHAQNAAPLVRKPETILWFTNIAKKHSVMLLL